MSNENLNKRIHEILCMCWHEWILDSGAKKEAYVCKKCHISKIIGGDDCKDYAETWEGFGILWDWWQKHEKFTDFLREASADRLGFIYWKVVSSPLALADATAEFFKEEQK